MAPDPFDGSPLGHSGAVCGSFLASAFPAFGRCAPAPDDVGPRSSVLRDVLRRAASCHRAKSIGGHPGRRALRSLLLGCAVHDDPPAAGNPFATAHAVAVARAEMRAVGIVPKTRRTSRPPKRKAAHRRPVETRFTPL